MSYTLKSNLELKAEYYLPSIKINQIFQEIDQDPELYGAGVVFVANDNSAIRASTPFATKSKRPEKQMRASCRADGKVIYIQELIFSNFNAIGNNLERTRSTLAKELVAAGWSCTGAAIGWVLIIGEVGGGAVTAGATWAAMPLTLTATSASTFQCGSAIGRSINIGIGNGDYNEWLNESPTYTALMTALDVVQMADVIKTLGKQAILVSFLRNKGIGSGNIINMYKRLPRASRKRLAEEILKLDHIELRKSRKALKEVLNGTKLIDDGTKAAKVFTQKQVRHLIDTKILEILGSAITTKGSLKNAAKSAKNSTIFIIGIGHR